MVHHMFPSFFALVGKVAVGAVFHTVGRIPEVAATLVAQGVKRAEAEHAVEVRSLCLCVAGEVGALFIGETLVTHSLCWLVC